MPLTPENTWSPHSAMDRMWVLLVYFSVAFAPTSLATPSDAGIYSRRLKFNIRRHGISRTSASDSKMKLQTQYGFISKPQMKYLTVEPNVVTVDSPFSLPPFDSLAPTPLPENSSPYCENAPPRTPQLPSPQPPPASQPNVPTRSLSPPPPTPPSIIPLTPPIGPLTPISPLVPFGPPSPPKQASGPPGHGLSPPVAFPPPSGPPPASHGGKPGSSGAAWCVAKPTVSDPIIQQALDYACGSGADCKSIQPSAHCYEPNTVLAHASYAFNSYWQNTKAIGGTCDFGGTAMLVTVDPSFEGCKFVLD